MKRLLVTVAVAVIGLIAGGTIRAQQASQSDATPTKAAASSGQVAPTFSSRESRYVLRPGDSFDLVFDYTPELNQTVMVQPDGFINLRGVNDLQVTGLTVPQLVDAIRGDYSKMLSHPTISVALKDFEKPYFIADGHVAKPGKYDLRGDTTVVQAIAIAGGFNSDAKHSQVVLFRRVDDTWTQAKLLDIKKMENQRNLAEDLHLRPGDMIFVPKNRLSKFKEFLPTANLAMVPTQF